MPSYSAETRGSLGIASRNYKKMKAIGTTDYGFIQRVEKSIKRGIITVDDELASCLTDERRSLLASQTRGKKRKREETQPLQLSSHNVALSKPVHPVQGTPLPSQLYSRLPFLSTDTEATLPPQQQSATPRPRRVAAKLPLPTVTSLPTNAATSNASLPTNAATSNASPPTNATASKASLPTNATTRTSQPMDEDSRRIVWSEPSAAAQISTANDTLTATTKTDLPATTLMQRKQAAIDRGCPSHLVLRSTTTRIPPSFTLPDGVRRITESALKELV